jgi:hypothetical protein
VSQFTYYKRENNLKLEKGIREQRFHAHGSGMQVRAYFSVPLLFVFSKQRPAAEHRVRDS